jgi:hypothetical protein
MTDAVSLTVEAFARTWLQETDAGCRLRRACNLELDQAIDAIFELLNAGYLKLEMDDDTLTDFTVCTPPSPPAEAIQRMRKTT